MLDLMPVRRADAARNAACIVSAARQLISERGWDLVLDEVARRAGVGSTTLYRNFPVRTDLLAVVYQDQANELIGLATELLDTPNAETALFAWLDRFADHVGSVPPLALAVTGCGPEHVGPIFERWHAALTASATRLLERAQDADAVRPGLDAAGLLALTSTIALLDPQRYPFRPIELLRSGLAA
ncbi:helix-turn-helix domain-containing protein [Nocardia sp. NPDC051030]|uniref:TetR/AcrR family transcriptional regulator n=1 Tax=Nocardia sp. NPDC051030 TaxID=3155162 RepID=UPI00342D6578